MVLCLEVANKLEYVQLYIIFVRKFWLKPESIFNLKMASENNKTCWDLNLKTAAIIIGVAGVVFSLITFILITFLLQDSFAPDPEEGIKVYYTF